MEKLNPAGIAGRWSLLALCAAPCSLQAHRLDECLQAAMVVIEPSLVHLQLTIEPGTEVATQILKRIDRDNNQSISRNEAATYVSALQRDLSLLVDGQPLPLKLDNSRFDTPAELRSGAGLIQLIFSAALNVSHAGAHQLTWDNRHLPAISVYLFNAIQPDSSRVKITGQQRNATQATGTIDFILDR